MHVMTEKLLISYDLGRAIHGRVKMSECVIYYNPRCGTCRNVKAILESHGVKPRVVEYLETPPSAAELEGILKKLRAGPEAITRTKEDEWQAHGRADLSRKEWLELIVRHPVLLQRPIVVMGDKALVARPAEVVEGLFK